jgi:hypothetical protein
MIGLTIERCTFTGPQSPSYLWIIPKPHVEDKKLSFFLFLLLLSAGAGPAGKRRGIRRI